MAEPLHTPKTVEKPWGREVWFADQAAYAGKILEVKKGCRLSLQYHERKTETLYLVSGKMLLTFRALAAGETPSASLVTAAHQHPWLPGQTVHIPVRTIHRFEALEDSVLLEVSTPDLTDVVRLQDDFARPARD
jgi:mannose-6-phosphate isomerase-like protein (cupin superfamily)